jgi:hypothetical protein
MAQIYVCTFLTERLLLQHNTALRIGDTSAQSRQWLATDCVTGFKFPIEIGTLHHKQTDAGAHSAYETPGASFPEVKRPDH